MGYHRAGFEVVGVDNRPMPRYPFEFHQADALEFVQAHGKSFDVIHASPPCQHYANVTRWRGNQDDHPDLVEATREALIGTGKLFIIENVERAPIRPDLILCGSQFGLRVRRHRWFETSFPAFNLLPPCNHRDLLPFMHKGERAYADAMECHWMNNREGRQAIPPAYCEFIGHQLLQHLEAAA
jgi:DNA (cytosine-5)-methyltransferase 1